MKEPTPRWQFWTAFITLIIGIVAMWMSLSGQYKKDGRDFENHEQRIHVLEQTKQELKDEIKEVKNEVRMGFVEMGKQQTEIRILIENKQNRK